MLLETQNFLSKFDKCQQQQIITVIIFLVLIAILTLTLRWFSQQKRICRKKLILIGTSGVGKTKLFNIAARKNVQRKQNKQDVDQFQEFQIGDHYDIVDSPSVEFEDSIDIREACIKQFNSYFKLNLNYIEKFYLIVSFERTDLMKKNCYKVYKYFNKFSSIIDIFITNFQLSEDEINDKQHLVKEFRIFVNDEKKIHFIRDDIQSDELIQLFIESANLVDLQDINQNDMKKNGQNLQGKNYQSIDQEENILEIQ